MFFLIMSWTDFIIYGIVSALICSFLMILGLHLLFPTKKNLNFKIVLGLALVLFGIGLLVVNLNSFCSKEPIWIDESQSYPSTNEVPFLPPCWETDVAPEDYTEY